MENNLQQTALQATIGLAALLDLLEDKGVITEDEYMQKYKEAKKILVDSVIEEMKKTL